LSMHRAWHYVDENERRKWQDPEAILQEIGVKPGMTLVDVGCGAGFFTLPAARMVGESGKVYGIDANSEALEQLRLKADVENLANIELKAARAEDTMLCRECADVVFFGIVLHDFDDASEVLKNARRMIKPDGKLANLDWKKVSMSFGPPAARRFDEAKARSLIEPAGFKVESVKDSGQYHYLIIARVG
jgi:ubiquinone/menaquinone biosynthesis C-methylase UbiE